jgi:hypothetical protein
MRHRGEALGVIQNYARLTPEEKEQLRLFLDSLLIQRLLSLAFLSISLAASESTVPDEMPDAELARVA